MNLGTSNRQKEHDSQWQQARQTVYMLVEHVFFSTWHVLGESHTWFSRPIKQTLKGKGSEFGTEEQWQAFGGHPSLTAYISNSGDRYAQTRAKMRADGPEGSGQITSEETGREQERKYGAYLMASSQGLL